VTDPDDHTPHIRRDERGVLVWCACRHWGYVGPDEDKARALHATHVEESSGHAPAP
jgi:hypothetical protein